MSDAEDKSVVQFNPEQLKARIAETVQSTFGMLIPQEQWEEMINKEVKAFFEHTKEWEWESKIHSYSSSNYHNPKEYRETLKIHVTPFRAEVWQAIREYLKSEIEKVLNNSNLKTNTTWDGSNKGIEEFTSDYLNRKLEELAPSMAKAMMSNIFGEAVKEAKEQIRNELGNI